MAMANFDLNADDALALLRAYAYGRSRVLDDVALALVEGRVELSQIRS